MEQTKEHEFEQLFGSRYDSNGHWWKDPNWEPHFSIRALNGLSNNRIRTLEQLYAFKDLRKLRGMGVKLIEFIDKRLRQNGLPGLELPKRKIKRRNKCVHCNGKGFNGYIYINRKSKKQHSEVAGRS